MHLTQEAGRLVFQMYFIRLELQADRSPAETNVSPYTSCLAVSEWQARVADWSNGTDASSSTTPAATAGYGDGTKSDRIIDKCCPSTASRDDSDTSAGGLSIPGVVDY